MFEFVVAMSSADDDINTISARIANDDIPEVGRSELQEDCDNELGWKKKVKEARPFKGVVSRFKKNCFTEVSV